MKPIFQVLSQPAALRAAMQKAGVSRETLANVADVSLRAVHRWLASEDLKTHRAMPPVQLQEILYWLQGEGPVEFRLPRSLTGPRELRAAIRRAAALGDVLKSMNLPLGRGLLTPREEFLEAQCRLADLKVVALQLAQIPEPDEVVESPPCGFVAVIPDDSKST